MILEPQRSDQTDADPVVSSVARACRLQDQFACGLDIQELLLMGAVYHPFTADDGIEHERAPLPFPRPADAESADVFQGIYEIRKELVSPSKQLESEGE